MQQEAGRNDREYARALKQGSSEWLAFKAGKVGASDMAKITAKLRNGGPGASRDALMGEVIAGRLAGYQGNGFTSEAMQWGTATEPLARRAYQGDILIRVEEVGCILHPRISYALASPDGLVGDNGLVEIKCPMTHNHIETISTQKINPRYVLQMQWQ